MAKKKKAKKKVKKVAEAPVDAQEEATPAPAIKEEATMKVVEAGQAKYYTQSEYDAKYG